MFSLLVVCSAINVVFFHFQFTHFLIELGLYVVQVQLVSLNIYYGNELTMAASNWLVSSSGRLASCSSMCLIFASRRSISRSFWGILALCSSIDRLAVLISALYEPCKYSFFLLDVLLLYLCFDRPNHLFHSLHGGLVGSVCFIRVAKGLSLFCFSLTERGFIVLVWGGLC